MTLLLLLRLRKEDRIVEDRIMEDRIEKAKELLVQQGKNWNYDSYMHGMYNGMEVILSVIEHRSPVFKDAPKEFQASSFDITSSQKDLI